MKGPKGDKGDCGHCGPCGETGHTGHCGETGPPGHCGCPGPTGPTRILIDQVDFLARDFVKNTAAADPDRSFANLYSPAGSVYVKTWASPVSTEPSGHVYLFFSRNRLRAPGATVTIKLHFLVIGSSDWIRFSADRDSVAPGATLGSAIGPIIYSDEIFVSEPAPHVDPTLNSANHYVATFSFIPSPGLDPYARVSRICPPSSFEWPRISFGSSN